MPGREFDIIERYFSGMIPAEGEQVVLGPGDDCAILEVPAGKQLAVSTDTLISGVHFPSDAPASAAAHRSLAANLSDLAAMGATPFAFTLAITLPSEDDAWLAEFSGTLGSLVTRYAIPLVGGNLARGELSITLTVMGTLPGGKALRRDGANVGDDVWVSGTLGDAGGGLAQLHAGTAGGGHLCERYYYPKPRIALGMALLDVATAAIDISDGLGADLGHICERSRCGARIEVDALPVSQPLAAAFSQADAWALAIGAGDDYELCFTAAPAQRDRIVASAQSVETPVCRIGEIITGSQVQFVNASGETLEFAHRGYEHFYEA